MYKRQSSACSPLFVLSVFTVSVCSAAYTAAGAILSLIHIYLDNAIQALNEAKNAAAEVTDMPELSSIEGKLNPVQADLSGVDVQAVQNAVGKMKVDLFTLKLAAAGMNAKLPEVEEKLDAIQKAGENLPLDQLGALTGKIDDLNTGMQGLNSGIGSLHTNLSYLDQSRCV